MLRAVSPPRDDSSQSLYVHVPFCVVKCGYCDFNSFAVPERDPSMDHFLDALDAELEARWSKGDRPRSVFIGGGTPTYLDTARFARLLEILADHVDLAGCPEVTIEANPESVDSDKARIAKDAGVNRVSIGAQSFQSDALLFLERAHDTAAAHRAFDLFRGEGFENISLDLIYAWPGQTEDRWADDLRILREIDPDHVSSYALTFEPGTKLTHQLNHGHVEPIDEDLERRLFETTHEVLADAGYEAYEVSNFAGRGGPCIHNDHYWQQGDYVGVGPGAATHVAGWRATNLKPIDRWASAVRSGLGPIGEAETLSRPDRAAEALWLGLRRKIGVSLTEIARRTGFDPAERFSDVLNQCSAEGQIVRMNDGVVRLTDEARPYTDEIGGRFLAAASSVRAETFGVPVQTDGRSANLRL